MRSFIATLRSLTLPYGAGPGTPRVVIGPDVPATIRNFNRPSVRPAKWSANVGIIAAILYYDALSNQDDFFFEGVTGPILDANGYLLTGYAYSATDLAADVIILREEFTFTQRRALYGHSVFGDIEAGADSQQGRVSIANNHYWGSAVNGANFAPLEVSSWYSSDGGGPFTSYAQLGSVPNRDTGGSRFFLIANTGLVTAETIVNTWKDTTGTTGISSARFGVFAGRTYRFTGSMIMLSSVASDTVIVRVREQLGGAPNLGTDPIIGFAQGNGAGWSWPLDFPLDPGADAVRRFYLTVARAAGTGNVSLFGATWGSMWELEDHGAL